MTRPVVGAHSVDRGLGPSRVRSSSVTGVSYSLRSTFLVPPCSPHPRPGVSLTAPTEGPTVLHSLRRTDNLFSSGHFFHHLLYLYLYLLLLTRCSFQWSLGSYSKSVYGSLSKEGGHFGRDLLCLVLSSPDPTGSSPRKDL